MSGFKRMPQPDTQLDRDKQQDERNKDLDNSIHAISLQHKLSLVKRSVQLLVLRPFDAFAAYSEEYTQAALLPLASQALV